MTYDEQWIENAKDKVNAAKTLARKVGLAWDDETARLLLSADSPAEMLAMGMAMHLFDKIMSDPDVDDDDKATARRLVDEALGKDA